MSQDWGEPKKGLSVEGNMLRVGGVTFGEQPSPIPQIGVGTHANSEIDIDLGGVATRFVASVGVDDEVGKRGSVRFRVIVDGKQVVETPVMRGGDPALRIQADLTKARTLRLVVDDAGDGNSYDHADWAEAAIETLPEKQSLIKIKQYPQLNSIPTLAKPDLRRTELHGPRIVGTTPGFDFIFRIPASGLRPLKFSATGLPAGLRLDPTTGVLSGQVERPGTYSVKLKVSGKGGRDERILTIDAGRHRLALTPPMGWNSWNVWGTAVDADKVRAAAKSFVDKGLADYGYAYVNIDDAWEAGRDKSGEIQANEKFPDMRNLADSVHRQGLKLGIYSSPGPKTCGGYEGSYQHEVQDAKTYGKWGIDYLKYDWCSYGGIARDGSLAELKSPYFTMREALNQSGRDIVYSLCQYGMGEVHTWGNRVGADLWRTTGDITDSWSSMASIGFDQANRAPYSRPSGWNDPDMMVVGMLGWGPNLHPTRLKPNEQVTHVTLWAMLAAPFLIGCDLTQLDDFTQSLLMNHDVIEIDQDPLGRAADRVWKEDQREIWSRHLWDGTTAVAFFNRGMQPASVVAPFKLLGLRGEQPVWDCWQRKDLGFRSQDIRVTVPAHGAILLRIGKRSH